MDIPIGFIGAALLVVAGILFLWRKRRIFQRTNQYGVERFPSFGAKIRARSADGIAMCCAIVLATGGVLSLALAFQDGWGGIVLLPLLAVALFFLM